jgi:microcystin-dependent protein
MSNMDSQIFLYIIISILVLSNIYLFYKTRKIQSETGKIEGFAVTDDMKKAINEIYNADIDAIRNLSGIATKITSANDTIVLPANMTEMKGDAYINRSLGVAGDLKVSGNVYFNNKDDLLMNILPRFIILAFYGDYVPKGWAPCDGKIYKLNAEGFAVETIEGGQYCPDLRGRMIISTGNGKKRNDYGGSETHTLTVAEMPAHSHNYWMTNNNSCYMGSGNGMCDTNSQHAAENTGGGQPHNNMPPYFTIPYICKL